MLKKTLRKLANSPKNTVTNPIINKARQIAAKSDLAYERLWETKKYYTHKTLSDGEMNAILRRMGVASFKEYVLWQKNCIQQRSFLPTDKVEFIRTIDDHYPEERERIISQADLVCAGKFDLLASGQVDMRRNKTDSGFKINWQKEPISGEVYPKIFSQWRWNPMSFRPGSADIKGTWELTRMQHFALLGQAYWLTDDSKYVDCFANTILDFVKHNPPALGIHWACTMDVALRVVSWIIGINFFQGSTQLTYTWWKKFLKTLVEHGRFIVSHLEFGTLDGKIITSNHHLSNLFGLYWLSMAFPHIDAGCVWRGIAETGLEREIQQQLYQDGGDFESSVPYLRLVAEMFLSAYALSVHHKLPFSNQYQQRLLSSLRFIKALRQNNHRIPRVGDDDSGRAHILSGYGNIDHESMDHLLIAGAKVLNCEELVSGVNNNIETLESFFWNVTPTEKTNIKPIANCEIFTESGIAVLRHDKNYLCFTNTPIGTHGFGNHKHNDQLAIEWAFDEQAIFVDGGSYTYSQDPDARNLFRSTRTHNTVMVDNEEQHILVPEWLFRLQACGEGQFNNPELTNHETSLSATHSCYLKLSNPLRHARKVTLSANELTIEDMFDSEQPHDFRWYFLLYPGLTVKISDQQVVISNDKINITLNTQDDNIIWHAEDAWYSPGYGIRVATKALVGTAQQQNLTDKTLKFRVI